MLFRKSLDSKRLIISNEDCSFVVRLQLFDPSVNSISSSVSGSIYLIESINNNDLTMLNSFFDLLKLKMTDETWIGVQNMFIDSEYNSSASFVKLNKIKDILSYWKSARPDLTWDGLFLKVK